MADFKQALIDAMNQAGIDNPEERAGIAAIAGGDPDLVNDIAIGAQTVVAYIEDRYDGSGWQAMKDCVGFNTPDIAARKDALREQFLSSGEFA